MAAAAFCWFATPASARDELVPVASDGPGPEAYDQVLVHQMGPRDADRVLVLMPGTMGGAGDFTLVGKQLTRRVDDLQVWAIDRRSQALEDTTAFGQALAGEISPQQMFDHYLGWLTNGGSPADHFRFRDTDQSRFARDWGMRTALDDARRVVLAAGQDGREVILGGHSLGASLTAAYAAWDFHGKPGFADVDGLVLIDGGLLGSFDAYDLAQAQQQIADLQTSNPFIDLLGIGFPESAGLFAEVGGIYARLDADATPPPSRTSRCCPTRSGHRSRHQPGPVRLRLRPRHLAGVARPAARQRRRPGGERRPARLGRRRGDPGRAAGRDLSVRSRRTRSSGTSRSG